MRSRPDASTSIFQILDSMIHAREVLHVRSICTYIVHKYTRLLIVSPAFCGCSPTRTFSGCFLSSRRRGFRDPWKKGKLPPALHDRAHEGSVVQPAIRSRTLLFGGNTVVPSFYCANLLNQAISFELDITSQFVISKLTSSEVSSRIGKSPGSVMHLPITRPPCASSPRYAASAFASLLSLQLVSSAEPRHLTELA